MDDEEYYGIPPDEDWTFETYWEAISRDAKRPGNSEDSRLLFRELILSLQTGQLGVLAHPKVCKFLADRLEEALSVPAAKVSNALKITRAANPRKRKYHDERNSFYIWYCRELEKKSAEKNEIISNEEIENWIKSQPGDIRDKIEWRTIENWIKTAKAMWADPRSAYNLFKNIPYENK